MYKEDEGFEMYSQNLKQKEVIKLPDGDVVVNTIILPMSLAYHTKHSIAFVRQGRP